MNKKEFEAEFLRRATALRVPFTLKGDDISINKFTINVLEPVPGDERKCIVRLSKNGNVSFEKPCTSYYLLQYIVSKIKYTK